MSDFKAKMYQIQFRQGLRPNIGGAAGYAGYAEAYPHVEVGHAKIFIATFIG